MFFYKNFQINVLHLSSMELSTSPNVSRPIQYAHDFADICSEITLVLSQLNDLPLFLCLKCPLRSMILLCVDVNGAT